MGEKTKNNIDVSIVIVNYKKHELLDNCLASLIKHSSGFTYEIIVVDNGSTDSIIEPVCAKYAEVVLVRNEKNSGFATANNQGIAVATGEYILFLNNDTIFIDNSIMILKNYLQQKEKNTKIILSCKLLNMDGTIQQSIFELPTILNIFSSNFFLYTIFKKSGKINKYHYCYEKISNPISVGVAIGAFLFTRTNLIRELNGFDTRFYFYAEEMDICKRLSNYGGKVVYFPQTAIIHIGGATTEGIPWFKYRNQTIAYLQYYQKHFLGLSFILILVIHYLGLLLRFPLNIILGIITFRKFYLRKGYYHFLQLFIYPKNQFKNSI